jgi:hypothetical protein
MGVAIVPICGGSGIGLISEKLLIAKELKMYPLA